MKTYFATNEMRLDSRGSKKHKVSLLHCANRAPRCNLADCALPDCFCSADGTVIPGAADTSVEQTPQMVTLSFNGAVTGTNMAVYQSLLTKAWLPDGDSQIYRFYAFSPSGLKDHCSATLRCKI